MIAETQPFHRSPRSTPLAIAFFAALFISVTLVGAAMWMFASPVSPSSIAESDNAAAVLQEGREVRQQILRVVQPALSRTKKAASDAGVLAALRSGDRKDLTAACNRIVTDSTEIDAFALFDAQGQIVAINSVYADGSAIAPERVNRILGLTFKDRKIIQNCVQNSSTSDVLEFQTNCDITPAFFDSTGLSVAYSTPVVDPATRERVGVASARLRFERLSSIIRERSASAGPGIEFVTDTGGYFSEEINSNQRTPPVPPEVLRGAVAPLVHGTSEYTLLRHDKQYIALLRLKELETLHNGGIQVMLMVDEAALLAQARQAKWIAAGWVLVGGVLGFLVAAFLHSVVQLRRSEHQSRVLIETALDAVVVTGPSGRITGWNPVAERIFGLSPEEAIGKVLQELIALKPAVKGGTTCLSELAEAGVRGSPCVEMTATHRNGSMVRLEVCVATLGIDERSCFSVFLRDVTARKAMEARLAQAQRLESIGQLSAGLAHEINTPTQYVSDNVRFVRDQLSGVLSVVGAYEQCLSPDTPATQPIDKVAEVHRLVALHDMHFVREELPRAIEESLEGLNRISAIVSAMKDFAHPNTSKEAVDINRVVDSTVTVTKHRWSPVANMDVSLDPRLPRVPCIAADVSQALLVLIMNAADAISDKFGSSSKGTIRLSTTVADGFVRITVQDNGSGMPDAVRSRIFTPFFSTKGIGKGMGQGLAVSRNVIVNKLGGSIEFETVVDEGTTFTISLPLREADALSSKEVAA